MAISRRMNKDVVYIYNGILLNHKKEWNNVIWSKTDGLRGYYYLLGEVSQIEKNIMISLICIYHLHIYMYMFFLMFFYIKVSIIRYWIKFPVLYSKSLLFIFYI